MGKKLVYGICYLGYDVNPQEDTVTMPVSSPFKLTCLLNSPVVATQPSTAFPSLPLAYIERAAMKQEKKDTEKQLLTSLAVSQCQGSGHAEMKGSQDS